METVGCSYNAVIKYYNFKNWFADENADMKNDTEG
jgi:hypothetical protein